MFKESESHKDRSAFRQMGNMKPLLLIAVLSLSGLEATKEGVENYKCGVRYELATALREEGICTQLRDLHPMCRKDLEVTFSESAPYVYVKGKSGKVSGVIPGK